MPTDRDPYLDDGMRVWIGRTAKKHLWRVAAFYELDDLIQDGYLCYAKCRSHYTYLTVKRHPTKDDRARFMARVKAAFENHITDLAWRRSRGIQEVTLSTLTTPETEKSFWENVVPSENEEASAALLLTSAPSEIKQLFQVLVEDVTLLGGYLRGRPLAKRFRPGKGWVTPVLNKKRRETNNEHFCRLVGLNPKETNLVEMVNQYFLTG